ncbi:interleukin-17 receptor B isoform X2 [Hemicordylus capensis]|uniref:interleukin-17 receptor B isoform X2 n=1 Tax=Hemicordylus capensis TaxID=884348 RepID=UPI00230422CB|nr:interleukin-17 receptor B isoform X2 [Hemicordylus capensis]
MNAATWVLLLLVAVLSGCSSEEETRPNIKCEQEIGPPVDWRMQQSYTPSDLDKLHAEVVEKDGICQFNITWIIKENASIQYLHATTICVAASGLLVCVRCDYTEKFQSQTTIHHQRWQFHYVGFPVEENTKYIVYAYNLPPANPGEDAASVHVQLSSPGCEENAMKCVKTCEEKGSLWNPNITVCNMNSEVEVNFTASRLSTKYRILLCESDECSHLNDPTYHVVFTAKENDTRISVRIPVIGESRKNFIELIPYFPKCGNDCRRHHSYQEQCTENPGNALLDQAQDPSSPPSFFHTVTHQMPLGNPQAREATANSVSILAGILAVLFVVCVMAAVLYLCKKHDAVRMWPGFYPAMQQTPAKILVIYPQEVCFQHVLAFADFLQEHCHSDVIIDMWQKRRIAEIGPVQWLATQKEIADKVIFLSPSFASPERDSACKMARETVNSNSECMFTLAFNLFCGDWKNQSSLHKYMVVYFNEKSSVKDLPSALNICPKYFLMKDIESFCRELSPSQRPMCEGTKSKCSWLSKMKSRLHM